MDSLREFFLFATISLSIFFIPSSLASQVGVEVKVLPWPLASEAAVSITFDDAYISHVDQAMPLLESHGFRGTFYLIVDKLFRKGKYTNVPSAAISEWQAAAVRGHEMASHTVSHIPLDTMEVSQMRAELINSKATLDSLFLGEPVVSLAYPFSRTNDAVEVEASIIYRSGRVGPPTDGSAVYNHPATVDLMRLKAYFPCSTMEQWNDAVNRTINGKGWLIEALHPINEPGFCRVATEDFAQHLQFLFHKLPSIWVAPVREVGERIRQWRNVAVQIEDISEKDFQMSIIGVRSHQLDWQVAIYLENPHLWRVQEENGRMVTSRIEEDALVFSWPQHLANNALNLRHIDLTHTVQLSWGQLKIAVRNRLK